VVYRSNAGFDVPRLGDRYYVTSRTFVDHNTCFEWARVCRRGSGNWTGVKWNVKKNILTVEISTPRVTSGIVTLPGTGGITVDGRLEFGEAIELRGGDHVLTRRLF